MQHIRNIQRAFLWGKGEKKKKWALVDWEKICKPKTNGGLGHDDPETLDKVLGEKLWWIWLKESDAPWTKVWKHKYANNWQESEHIRKSGSIKGSHIWNKVWENRAIVQKHSAWEIRDGNLAWFWEVNSQQEPKLCREDFENLKKDTDQKGLHRVNDFWDHDRNEGKWRLWKNLIYSSTLR